MNRELYPHQVKAIEMLRQSIGSGKRRPLLQAPTGFGKTMLAAAIVEGAITKGNRVIFTVPAISLVDQTVQALWDEGLRDVGVIQGRHAMTDWAKPVQVASVQTLQKRELPAAEVVVIDEAHRWFQFYENWFLDPAWRAKPFIGLSATPWTRGLGKYYDDLIIAATTAELIEAGYLAKFRVFAPSHPDLSGVRTVAGDYHEGDLSGVMNDNPLVADVVDTWLKRAGQRPTFCFAVDRAHAKHLQDKFAASGISTGYIDAYTPLTERAAIERQFHSGDIKVVCNVGCLTTGIDWDVRCIVLARPTKSEMLYVQMLGRGLRTAEGKDDLLVLDHSDTTLRMGFVTDIHHDKLDDGKPRAAAKEEGKVRLPKECPQCAFLKPPRLQTCPACGFKADKAACMEEGEGELVELTGRKGKGGKSAVDQIDKASFHAQLKGYAALRGKSDKWVLANYKNKFGVWPGGFDDTRAINPGAEVLGWIKHRNIAWAKSQGKAKGASHALAS
jgi:DNA repair protein RadD